MLSTVLVPVVQTAPPLDPRKPMSTWPSEAGDPINLTWNVANAQSALDKTTVHIATDGKFLYVRFDAEQHEPVIDNQHSNDLIVGGSNFGGGLAWSDDSV